MTQGAPWGSGQTERAPAGWHSGSRAGARRRPASTRIQGLTWSQGKRPGDAEDDTKQGQRRPRVAVPAGVPSAVSRSSPPRSTSVGNYRPPAGEGSNPVPADEVRWPLGAPLALEAHVASQPESLPQSARANEKSRDLPGLVDVGPRVDAHPVGAHVLNTPELATALCDDRSPEQRREAKRVAVFGIHPDGVRPVFGPQAQLACRSVGGHG
jgi:hypothetical protein